MKKTISVERLMSQLPPELKAELLKKQGAHRKKDRSQEEVLNFKGYFKKEQPVKGVNGPELVDDQIAISLYHFLELNGENPQNYNTSAIGVQLQRHFNVLATALYSKHKINKYDIRLLEHSWDLIDNYKK